MWTEGRIKSFIVSVLRAGSRKWPPKFETLKEAWVGKKINEKTGRLSNHYLCAGCSKEHPSANVQVDHITPVIDPEKGFTTWDSFITNLFCEKNNLQVLCSECHDKKTAGERIAAKNSSKNRKR